MKIILKKIIRTLGYELHRNSTAQNEYIKTNEAKNTIIELIGPSGIGKTTLQKMVSKSLNCRWNLSYPNSTKHIGRDSKQLDELYRIILFRKLVSLYEHEKDIDRYTEISSFFIKRIQQDRVLKMSGFLDKGGYFLDDGICHNFTSEIIQIIENNEVDNAILNKFFVNRNIIVLEAPINRIVDNLRKRQLKNKGALNDWLSVYGEHGIKEFIQHLINNIRKLEDYACQFGCSVYTIDLIQSDHELVKQVREVEYDVLSKL